MLMLVRFEWPYHGFNRKAFPRLFFLGLPPVTWFSSYSIVFLSTIYSCLTLLLLLLIFALSNNKIQVDSKHHNLLFFSFMGVFHFMEVIVVTWDYFFNMFMQCFIIWFKRNTMYFAFAWLFWMDGSFDYYFHACRRKTICMWRMWQILYLQEWAQSSQPETLIGKTLHMFWLRSELQDASQPQQASKGTHGNSAVEVSSLFGGVFETQVIGSKLCVKINRIATN